MKVKYGMFVFAKIVQDINYWSWQELEWGQKNHVIRTKDIVEYARYILDEDIKGFDEVLELSIANEDEDITPLLAQLVNFEVVQTQEDVRDKWQYALLLDLYNNQDSYDDVYENIENIYSDFDYPEDMTSLIRYMPLSSGRSIEESWKMYLRDKGEKFAHPRK